MLSFILPPVLAFIFPLAERDIRGPIIRLTSSYDESVQARGTFSRHMEDGGWEVEQLSWCFGLILPESFRAPGGHDLDPLLVRGTLSSDLNLFGSSNWGNCPTRAKPINVFDTICSVTYIGHGIVHRLKRTDFHKRWGDVQRYKKRRASKAWIAPRYRVYLRPIIATAGCPTLDNVQPGSWYSANSFGVNCLPPLVRLFRATSPPYVLPHLFALKSPMTVTNPV